MKQLIELAIEEAKNIKIHATSKEKNNLNLRTFDGSRSNKCIYGQMTENCYNKRATELITKCCERVYYADSFSQLPSIDSAEINGTPSKMTRYVGKGLPGERLPSHSTHYSPIEVLVQNDYYNGMMDYAGEIISFIKDETKILEL